eukprot:11480058-Karenia_brevis.AAC.1
MSKRAGGTASASSVASDASNKTRRKSDAPSDEMELFDSDSADDTTTKQFVTNVHLAKILQAQQAA